MPVRPVVLVIVAVTKEVEFSFLCRNDVTEFLAWVTFFWSGIIMCLLRICSCVLSIVGLFVEEGNSSERIELIEATFIKVLFVSLGLVLNLGGICLILFFIGYGLWLRLNLWFWFKFLLELVKVARRVESVIVASSACRARSIVGVMAKNFTVKVMNEWT